MTGEFNVRQFGATGDGISLDTGAIQEAIDACDVEGGGTVVVPPGRYLCGTLHLCDELDLWIRPGATLVASKDDALFDSPEHLEFPEAQGQECSIFHYSLLAGDGIGNVRIIGGGSLDDQRHHRHGPKPIGFKNCHHITIRDVNIYNSPNYAVSLGNCESIIIDKVRVFYSNADGIDLDSCRDAQVTNCQIQSRDDAIVLKGSLSFDEPTPSINISISNCDLATSCVGFKIGSETNGDFKNILFSNCIIHPLGFARPPLAGIALESVDGGAIDGLTASNITMHGMKSPLLIRLGKRLRGNWPKVPGSISNVMITNLNAVNSHFPMVIGGLQKHPIEKLTLSNLHLEFNYSGSGNFAPGETYRDNGNRPPGTTDLAKIPESESQYPDIRMFGDPLPAWAIFARHVRAMNLSNVTCYLKTPDQRPAELLIDASDVHMSGVHFQGS
ncbi:hypothetical protein GF325_01465 [Candidatus Bathyarchaeota archaeon]|nr:hypothetical protein [Candidatus Bathyarchaeota archaeon]